MILFDWSERILSELNVERFYPVSSGPSNPRVGLMVVVSVLRGTHFEGPDFVFAQPKFSEMD